MLSGTRFLAQEYSFPLINGQAKFVFNVSAYVGLFIYEATSTFESSAQFTQSESFLFVYGHRNIFRLWRDLSNLPFFAFHKIKRQHSGKGTQIFSTSNIQISQWTQYWYFSFQITFLKLLFAYSLCLFKWPPSKNFMH